ncbi:hypothetical protein Dolphis_70 [Pseudomonas phage Dolphis]|nr:hypothetical protein Dolphis_70 [Pseudomonas phage Dolphis]
MNNEQRKKRIADVAEWMKDHQYTQLVNANGVEVWRCEKPDTIHLAFDICVTRFGMSIAGDIGSLVFRVGSSYGINFLRHQSDGYLYEKLEEAYRKDREFDADGFMERIVWAICDRIYGDVDEDLAPEWAPEEKRSGVTADSLKDWLTEKRDLDIHGVDFPFDDLVTLIDAAQDIANTGRDESNAAHDFLADNEKLLGVSDTWEWRLTKPAGSVMNRLFYVRHAASCIMAIKEAAQVQEVAE